MRERSSETSLSSPCRRVCGDERGEATEEAVRAAGVRCERATSPSPAPEGAEETEVRSRATDECPDNHPPPPPTLARPRPSKRGGSLMGHNTMCTLRLPPSYPAHLKGGKKKRIKSQAAELPKEFPHVLCMSASSQKVPTAPETNLHKSHKSHLWYKFYPYT